MTEIHISIIPNPKIIYTLLNNFCLFNFFSSIFSSFFPLALRLSPIELAFDTDKIDPAIVIPLPSKTSAFELNSLFSSSSFSLSSSKKPSLSLLSISKYSDNL